MFPSRFSKAVFSGGTEYTRIGLLELGRAHVLHILFDTTGDIWRNLFLVAPLLLSISKARDVCLLHGCRSIFLAEAAK